MALEAASEAAVQFVAIAAICSNQMKRYPLRCRLSGDLYNQKVLTHVPVAPKTDPVRAPPAGPIGTSAHPFG